MRNFCVIGISQQRYKQPHIEQHVADKCSFIPNLSPDNGNDIPFRIKKSDEVMIYSSLHDRDHAYRSATYAAYAAGIGKPVTLVVTGKRRAGKLSLDAQDMAKQLRDILELPGVSGSDLLGVSEEEAHYRINQYLSLDGPASRKLYRRLLHQLSDPRYKFDVMKTLDEELIDFYFPKASLAIFISHFTRDGEEEARRIELLERDAIKDVLFFSAKDVYDYVDGCMTEIDSVLYSL